ncbi:MAG: hypothetical protein GX182_01775 [Firmicutes bacterium]|jgi:spore coat protein CotF|nr:hypothetical protein [Bacillota bacterium]
MALTQMELNLLREMIGNAVASSNKLGMYAQQATEPQLKSFFQNASQECAQKVQNLMGFLS